MVKSSQTQLNMEAIKLAQDAKSHIEQHEKHCAERHSTYIKGIDDLKEAQSILTGVIHKRVIHLEDKVSDGFSHLLYWLLGTTVFISAGIIASIFAQAP